MITFCTNGVTGGRISTKPGDCYGWSIEAVANNLRKGLVGVMDCKSDSAHQQGGNVAKPTNHQCVLTSSLLSDAVGGKIANYNVAASPSNRHPAIIKHLQRGLQPLSRGGIGLRG